ncbi:DUF1656 domain-containing protein [Dyella flava]|uniref:DUF1656 domain-containing protein n=1 Tax=Dyella flava TaxID=1920170 RepID=A0ABS2K3N0_9GAMM|nr:DUF1656 domain-containing protein [Dyella flava]MBM7124928.1 DUF1656 domain-containing protein [Dyella flava]GLQ49882.1 hypothetical protein GCM10010872_13310 [Dyella flava]
MLEELHIVGVYMPAALVWAVLAGIAAHVICSYLRRFRWFVLFGHPGIFELALLSALWWLITILADMYPQHG